MRGVMTTLMTVESIFLSFVVEVHLVIDEDPITVMRVVKTRTTDYTRLQNVYRLIEDIVDVKHTMDVFDAREALNEIMQRRRPYRRWVTTLGTALLAGGVAVVYNVSFVLDVVAAISALPSQLVTRRLGQWGVSER